MRQQVIKDKNRSWHQECPLDCDPLLFLQRYHNSNTTFRTKPYTANTEKILKDVGTQSSRNKHRDNLTMNNSYSGALYFPSHNLLIQSQACNKYLYTDIHAVAQSNFDKSFGVPHAVISQSNSNDLVSHVRETGIQFPP